ncbi:MAG: Rhodanese-related sulfurtransferase [uncultured Candidatus Poseidoniales archaeon]|jgi:phage shock protein E|nr:MAG: Rhodanese-related sulfurtransferase [uncultured Candidatus Poseidoniales archaeon]MBT5617444.1 rhodanese-like domain-containing protein [Euryarchaeota archaeon]MBT5727459.1 rhodanese-like domain-containing protein [Euryarchaeota archaeon]
MKKVVSLFLACLLSGCIASSADWQRVDVEEFDQAIEENESAFLLDVRTQTEWEQDGHLENATLIPHSELEEREGELPSEKDTMILLYCRSGNRSQDAAQTLVDLGFTNIIELETGINGWKDAGMPVSYE